MSLRCACAIEHPPRLIVITGGPGAGKTALLELVAAQFCQHVVVLPEAASILWRGGFPRHDSTSGRRSAQRMIAALQLELQRMAIEAGRAALIVCDRGTLDGLAYWPGSADEYVDQTGLDRERELARYAAIIHLHPPSGAQGYRPTEVRIESAEQAAHIDTRILHAWNDHPRRFLVDGDRDFLGKLTRGIELVRAEIPACCRPR